MVELAGVRALAGRASWIAGLLPQLKPFVRQLWAAATAGGSNKNLVYLKQIKPALVWLERFFAGVEGELTRQVYVVDRTLQGMLLEVDASPWGGGAACWIGTTTRSGRRAPDSFVATRWTEEDGKLVGGVIGDAGSQALWEAYMFLLAVRHFVTIKTRGRIAIVGDALGVWTSLVKLSAKSFGINEIAKEVAMLLAPLGHELIGIHVWSEANELADTLSRLQPGEQAPSALAGAVRGTIGRPRPGGY